MKKIIVSGVAIGQLRSTTKKGATYEKNLEVKNKIKRMIVLGEPTFVYATGEYIIRYFDINMLINKDGVVLNVWRHRDDKQEYIVVSEHTKDLIKNESIESIDAMSFMKHELITRKLYDRKITKQQFKFQGE